MEDIIDCARENVQLLLIVKYTKKTIDESDNMIFDVLEYVDISIENPSAQDIRKVIMLMIYS